jgi:hypothetical protein
MGRAAWLAALIVLGVGAGVLAFGVGGSDPEPPNATTRSATSSFCPKVSLAHGAGMEFYDHLLRNLGAGLMGESRYYRGQGQTLDIHVGFDVLEVYEDLDFLAQGTSVIRGRKFELSKSAGVNASFWAAVSDLRRGPESCRRVTIVGRGGGMNAKRFRDLLATLKFPAS